MRKIIFIFLLLAGCKQPQHETASQAAPSMATRYNKQQIFVDTAVVWVEVVDKPENRQQGLMFRESMPQDEGMLFVFDMPEMQSFWMKNTYLPLDIAFIDPNGIITDIHQMTPLNDSLRYNSSVPVPYALELNQGWFKSKGITVGKKVKLFATVAMP
jgi:uncharacterized membrane protein (UPF0127 family)